MANKLIPRCNLNVNVTSTDQSVRLFSFRFKVRGECGRIKIIPAFTLIAFRFVLLVVLQLVVCTTARRNDKRLQGRRYSILAGPDSISTDHDLLILFYLEGCNCQFWKPEQRVANDGLRITTEYWFLH